MAAQLSCKQLVQGSTPWRSFLAESFNGRTPFLQNGCLQVQILSRLLASAGSSMAERHRDRMGAGSSILSPRSRNLRARRITVKMRLPYKRVIPVQLRACPSQQKGSQHETQTSETQTHFPGLVAQLAAQVAFTHGVQSSSLCKPRKHGGIYITANGTGS